MFRFLIRKTFFDMWDNLFPIILLNLGFYLVLGALFGSLYGLAELSTVLIPKNSFIGMFFMNVAVFVFCGALFSVYLGAASAVTRLIADFSKPSFGAFLAGLKETWRPSLFFGMIQGLIMALILNAANVYMFNVDNVIFPFLFFMIFWIYLSWLLASQFFFALQARFDKKLFKNMRKMFILFLDNTVFTIFGLGLTSLLVLFISFFLMLIVPGLASILLLQAVALRLRILKYDYLEANPQANRRKIPWQTLIAADREMVGKRTLKGMFMPWKE